MRLSALLPTLALVAAPAFAQEVHWGLSVGVSMPQADAKDAVDNKIGFTLGGNAVVPFNGGHALRPRLDISAITQTVSGVDFSMTTTALGADYNYFVSGKVNEGLYMIAGLGYASTKFSVSSGSFDSSESKGALTLAVGAGFQFTKLMGADLRYTMTKPDFGGSDPMKNNAINISVTFQF